MNSSNIIKQLGMEVHYLKRNFHINSDIQLNTDLEFKRKIKSKSYNGKSNIYIYMIGV